MDDLHWLFLQGVYVTAVVLISALCFGVVTLGVVFLSAFTGKVKHERED